MKLNRITDNDFGINFKKTRNENYEIIEKSYDDIGTNISDVSQNVQDVSIKVSNASSDNVFFGSDGSKTIDEIKNHTDDLFIDLSSEKALVTNNAFYVSGGGYFFYRVKAINELSTGKKISFSVNFPVDNPAVKKECRFVDVNGMTVGTIISFDGKDGFYLKENISIPPGAFKIEFRIDARELTTTTVAFENPRIIVGAFVGGMNNALMKKIDTVSNGKFGIEDINCFPDPLLITEGTWINYKVPDASYYFQGIGDTRCVVLKTLTRPKEVAAIGHDLDIVSQNIMPGNSVDFNVKTLNVYDSIGASFFAKMLFFDENKKELDYTTRKEIRLGANGSFTISKVVIPSRTRYIRLRLDADTSRIDSVLPQSSIEIHEINLTRSSGAEKKKTAVDLITVNSLIKSAMQTLPLSGTYYVSPNGSDSNEGTTTSTAFSTLQKAVNAGASTIMMARGDYYNVSVDATSLKDITIIPWDHATFDQAKPNGKMINLYGGEKLSGSWVSHNSIYKQTYSGNTYYTKVFVDKSLPIDTGGTRPSYNAFLWEDNKKLVPKLTVAEVESTVGTFTFDGTNVYINPYSGSIPIANRTYIAVTKGTVLNTSNVRKVILQDVEAKFCQTTPIIARNIKDLRAQNCAANYGGQADGWSLDNSNGILTDCEGAWNRNDGFNIHGYGDTVFINCSGHDNEDDGISHHDGCTGAIIGGEWYNNGKGGISPTYGSIIALYGDISSYNNAYGLYIVGTKGVTPRRKMDVSSVQCYGNSIAGALISHEYDVVMNKVNFRNNPVGVQVESNGSLLIEESTINENTSVGINNAGESTVTIKDCGISDNKCGVQNTGNGTTVLSRNGILYNTVSGIKLTAGTITMDKRNNLYGNATDYEGSIPQSEKDKNVSIPAI
ncbi:right-handed parallel beta-helix repeat-containing protein [Bacillus wiedmannii]|uniref:right-handed parallel beta-helix repeat-containing protein n=1 Tax=Bacillus wiedmannii TaxID=1890302 RepID=UPI0025A143F8|nr:right-handed parallel beta-helix repeat-containing protein [Bacillus wiedmannii]MDM5270460.1 right-handed parallel beta-helix repeat-containing protein [Bacillus wiedmannii]